MNEEYIYSLIEALASNSVLEQVKASETLTELGTQALDLLIQALDNTSIVMQEWIVVILKRLNDKRAIVPLLRFVQTISNITPSNISLLNITLSTIAQLLEVESLDIQIQLNNNVLIQIEALVQDLNLERDDEQDDKCIEAIWALSNLKDDRVTKILISTLENGDYPELRYAAAEALGKVGNITALPSLIQSYQHDVNIMKFGGFDANIKDAASKAIKRIQLREGIYNT